MSKLVMNLCAAFLLWQQALDGGIRVGRETAPSHSHSRTHTETIQKCKASFTDKMWRLN